MEHKVRLALTQDQANLNRALLTDKFPRLANPGPILSEFLQRFFPKLLLPVRSLNTENDTWAMYYSFEQYLWQPQADSKRGFGIFFTFGASDANPNPLQYFYSLGISGNGIVPGRPDDNFGIGWALTQFSDDFVPLLRQRISLGSMLRMQSSSTITQPSPSGSAQPPISKSWILPSISSSTRPAI